MNFTVRFWFASAPTPRRQIVSTWHNSVPQFDSRRCTIKPGDQLALNAIHGPQAPRSTEQSFTAKRSGSLVVDLRPLLLQPLRDTRFFVFAAPGISKYIRVSI
jgi:hypothetical protein